MGTKCATEIPIMKKANLALFLLIVMIGILNAQQIDQRTQNIIKAKFKTAKSAYKDGDYNSALEKLKEIDELMQGYPLATALDLKVATFIKLSKYSEAKAALHILEGLKLSDSIMGHLTTYTRQIEEMGKKEEARILADKKKAEEEKARLLAEKKAEEEVRKVREEQIKLLPAQIKETIRKFKGLEEGRPYLITNSKHITKSPDEKTIILFYGNKYISYIVPSLSVHKDLFKDQVEYS